MEEDQYLTIVEDNGHITTIDLKALDLHGKVYIVLFRLEISIKQIK